MGHTYARNEMHRYPLRLIEKTASGVVNLPPSGPIFLDACCRGPGPQPLLHARLAINKGEEPDGETDPIMPNRVPPEIQFLSLEISRVSRFRFTCHLEYTQLT